MLLNRTCSTVAVKGSAAWLSVLAGGLFMKLSSQLLKSLAAGSFFGLAVGTSSAVYAATQTFTTIPDPSGVSASATFVTSTNQISLTLTNTTANIQSLAQTLSDISFSVTG